MTSFIGPHHRVFAGYKAGLECFHVTRAAVLRQFGKAALAAATDAASSAEDAEAAAVVASSVPEVVASGGL